MSAATARAAKEEECTAFHEAGHAVAAVILRKAFQDVTIEPGDGTLGLMRCRAAYVPDEFEPNRSRIEREVMIALAGSIAEAKHKKGRSNHVGSGQDYHDAIDYAGRLSLGDSEEAEAHLKWLGIRTRKLIDLHWSAVERLAGELLQHKTISAGKVRVIVR